MINTNQYHAVEWMQARGLVAKGEYLEYPHPGECPGCVNDREQRDREHKELLYLRRKMNILRQERDWLHSRVDILLRERPAAPAVVDLTSDEPAAKKQRAKPQSVWVLHKGDWPDESEKVVDIEVLGTYSSRANAQASLEEFLESEGWEGDGGDWGYDQGESRSNIQIAETELDVPTCLY